MHFNSFPDDCILLIFARLPLRTLMQIEIVCHRWSTLQSIACRKQHSLLLLIRATALKLISHYEFGKNENNMLDLSSEVDKNKPMFVSLNKMVQMYGLELSDLSEQTCDWLIQKLPNIRSFQISILVNDAENIVKLLISLFTAWSSKLITLKLYLSDNFNQSDYMSLLELINNRLFALRNLTLCIFTYLRSPEHLDHIDTKLYQLDLPVLSRLNRFYFTTLDEPDIILDSLVCYGQPNENLKQIRLNRFVSIDESIFRKFRSLNPDLTRLFTDILQSIPLSKLPLVELQTLFRQFPNQQSQITIYFGEMSYTLEELIISLALLKHLISLDFVVIKYVPDSSKLGFNLPQLNSIKRLSLDGFHSHFLLSQLNIAWIFPSLQILVISQERTQSRYEIVGDYFICLCINCSGHCSIGETKKEQFRACLRLLLEPLKQCTKLRKINFKPPPEYNIEDIVGECLGK